MANIINGTDKNDNLKGTSGDDEINGLAGADTMTGGLGDDIYHIDNVGDKIIEVKNSGFDSILSTIDYSLAKNADVEDLFLAGAAIKATGNALNNFIGGNDLANIIDGGKGADLLIGGKGDDTYLFDNVGDGVFEAADAGRDTIVSTAALKNAFDNVEDYTFKTATKVDFTGNDLDNEIIGGTADDQIHGGGGADDIDGGKGADLMIGGTGSDSYVVDNVKDVVAENFGEGFDSIVASVSIDALATNVETAILVGNAALHVTGNELFNALIGNSGANVIDGGAGPDLMSGGFGDDTYVVDEAGDIIFEAEKSGKDTVQSGVNFTLSAQLENLILTGKADINGTGNELDNVLIGNDGKNLLSGGAGKDVMNGGKGDDQYFVDNAGDKVIETLSAANGGGRDTVHASIDFSLAGLANVEDLVLSGNALKGTGNALANDIFGNSGDNLIDGGKGADGMAGSFGDDTYVVDTLGDFIQEGVGQGLHDKVIATVALSHAFGGVEDYVFNTSKGLNFTADDSDNVITGGNGNDVIDARGGTNQIDGGKGADTMIGGNGRDVYFVDNLGDKVVESFDGGSDVVLSTVSIALWDNVEQAQLEGTAALNITGNALDNRLFGNDGANVIDGGGGADHMEGGKGNDTYFFVDPLDEIVEFAGGGIDTVKSTLSLTLEDNLENLTLLGGADLAAFGNALANVLTGNDGKNVLAGNGGNDTLIGGKGDDTYFVGDPGDKIVESVANAAGGGIDTVKTTTSFSLAGLANVDNVTIINGLDIDATGNARSNHLIGGDGNNILDGGAGTDMLIGGQGNDTYIVDSLLDSVLENPGEGTDTIISKVAFGSGSIDIENYVFQTGQAVSFTGTGRDNVIEGGSGADTINGAGGKDQLFGKGGNDHLNGGSGFDVLDGGIGADVMQGFGGTDVYFVDNAKDQVIEAANGGDDEILATVSIAELFDNVEVLQLEGTANLNGKGNALGNVIIGNAGSNVLDGGAGDDNVFGGTKGNDTLTGGAGHDAFLFTMDFSHNLGHVTVTDYVRGEDVLDFGLGVATLGELIEHTSKIVDHGLGKAVDLVFDGGSVVTLVGIGTGQIHSVQDLVTSGVQIEFGTHV